MPFQPPSYSLWASAALVVIPPVAVGWTLRTATLDPRWDIIGLAVVGIGVVLHLVIQRRVIQDQIYGFREFLNRVADWAVVVDPNQRVTYVTDGARRYGFDPLAMRGRPWGSALPPDHHGFVAELHRAAEASPEGVAGPASGWLSLPRGDRRSFEVTAHRTGRQRRSCVLFFRDVTERERIKQNMAHLDHMASVAHLSAGVAHNFNNVLSSIILNAGLLAEAEGDDRQRLFNRIVTSAEKGAALCRKLLTFARGDSPAVGPISAASLLGDLVTLFETEANRHAVKVTWSAEPDLSLLGDRTQVQQILLSLLFNAREAIGQNGRIEIKAVRSGQHARVAVCNSGRPIPPHQLPLIFLPFFSARTDVVQGTGMGLPVSLGLAAGMGGNIEVESPAEGPTCFTLVLPVVGTDTNTQEEAARDHSHC